MDIITTGGWIVATLLIGFMLWAVAVGQANGGVNVGKENKTTVKWILGILLIAVVVFGLNSMGIINLRTASIVPGGSVIGCDSRFSIDSHTFRTTDSLSGSKSAVAGTVKLYEAGQDPKDPLISPLASGALSSGVVTINGSHKTCTQYRMILDGGASGTYYSKDFGIVSFSDSDYNTNTGKMETELDGFVSIATITDMLLETTNSTDINGGNFNVNCTQGTAELCSGADAGTNDQLVYDKSVGDGSWYVNLLIESSGSNQGLEKPVICFDEGTNPPEFNEITAMTMQRQTGSDLSIPSNILNYWTNKLCIPLNKGFMESGVSATYKMSVTYNEANLDTNDEWVMVFDDLGEINGKDIGLRTGATGDKMTFDAQA